MLCIRGSLSKMLLKDQVDKGAIVEKKDCSITLELFLADK